MFRKVVLVAFLAAVLSQAHAGSKDEAKTALAKLAAAVDEAVAKAQSQVNAAFDKVNEKANKLRDKAKDALQGELDKLQSKLDEINKKAKEKGVDMTACEPLETEFTQIPDVLVNEEIACITDKVSQAQGYVNDALSNIKAITDEVASYGDEIDNCGHGIHEVKCLAKLVVKITEQCSKLPVKLTEDIAKTTLLIETLVPALEVCAEEKLKEVGVRAGETLAEIALCAGVNV